MREPASVRRSFLTALAFGRVLVLLAPGLTGGTASRASAIGEPETPQGEAARPQARWFHGAAVLNGRIYVIGGAGRDNRPLASVEVYEPATGRWGSCARLPTPRAALGVATVGGKIYAVGGTTIGVDKLAVLEEYDPAADEWTRKADMPTARNALSAVAVDGKLYAIGGWGFDRPAGGWETLDTSSGGQDFATVEVYDPRTDTWTARANMPAGRNHMAASAVGSKIYVVGGGRHADAGGRALDDEGKGILSLMEVYDTATDRWTPAPEMPSARCVLSSAVVDGRLFAIGGVMSRGRLSSPLPERMRSRWPLSVVATYDPESGRWTTGTALATARGWHTASVVDGRLYLIGGRAPAPDGGLLEADGAFPDVEVYATSPR